MNSSGSATLRGLALAGAAGVLLLAFAGCKAVDLPLPAPDLPPPAPDLPSAPVRRPLVPEPRLTLAPDSIALAAGERVVLTARPSGGEAIRFSIDWSIREGSAGGTLRPEADRHEDGSYSAVYQAPDLPGGPFHVSAALHEFPSVRSEVSILVRPSP